MKKRSPNKNTDTQMNEKVSNSRNSISLLLIAVLFILDILWFYGLGFHTIMGDDLIRWNYFSENADNSFVKTCFLYSPSGPNKYRPVFNVIHFVLFKLFSSNYQLFFYFNILFNFLVIIALYLLVKKISNQNDIVAFFVSIVYLTSRFSYYNILQVNGILETFSLFLLVLIIYFSVDLIRKGEPKYAFFLLGLNLLIVFTHERYIALTPFLFFLLLFNKSTKGVLKNLLLLLVFMPALLNFTLKKLVFNLRFLEGTGGIPIDLNPVLIMKFLIAGSLNVLGVNAGPEYLDGISFKSVDALTNIVIVGINLIIFSVIILAILRYRKLHIDVQKKELKIAFLWGLLFFFLLLGASVTIRQELRWLYAPFVVFIVYFSHLYSKLSLKSTVRYFLLIVLCGLIIRNDMYYKTFLPNVFFMGAQKIADSVYDETIRKYGTGIRYYSVYIEKHAELDWPLQDSLFFAPYLGDKSFRVNYVEDVQRINLKNAHRKRILIFRLDWPQRRLINVTNEVLNNANTRL